MVKTPFLFNLSRQIVHFFRNCRSERSRGDKHGLAMCLAILDIKVDSDNKTKNWIFQFVKW